MLADPAAQTALLDVQELDSRADLLRHQRTSMPELAEIANLSTARADLDGRRRDHQIVVDDLTVAQKKADADVEQVKTRRTRDQQRMDQGLITNPKDLERMQGELASLERRISVLEDEELEVMEQLEEAQSVLDEITGDVADLDERLAALGSTRDDKLADIDQELAEVTGKRGPAAERIPADLIALYERIREKQGGVGAALLRARECSGCRLGLDNAELAQIRAAAPDLVVRHEECTRILVRTSESGL